MHRCTTRSRSVGSPQNRLYAKYTNLVKKSVFVNSAQAKDDYLAKNTKASFNFVAKRYDSEPDSLYTVEDKELRALL